MKEVSGLSVILNPGKAPGLDLILPESIKNNAECSGIIVYINWPNKDNP